MTLSVYALFTAFIGTAYLGNKLDSWCGYVDNGHNAEYGQDKYNQAHGNHVQPEFCASFSGFIDIIAGNVDRRPSYEGDKTGNYHQAEQDLRAHRIMARWTFGIFIVTASSVVVMAIGTWLVYVTLSENRKLTTTALEANRLTRQSFVAERRPWMGLESIERVTSLVWDKGKREGRITFRFVMQNHGHSPAIHVDLRTRIMPRFATFHGDMFDEFSVWNRERPLGFGGSTVFPGKIFKATEGISISKEELDAYFLEAGRDGWKERCHLNMVLVGSIQYRTTLDDSIRFTDFVFMLMIKDGDGAKLIAPIDGDVAAENIVLKNWPVRNDMIT